ncbi:hypothetical protein H4219_004889 [Mycoemilia scoparia]|uniref:Uncharacterized protein n=1 Tax=Mycoemilia scoparia TaxID=417184 RepID=A0A9W7ZQ50_9FUNG|nr:hypothetical protein H4219_004889 [Mycoemilia scoparia]
MDAIMIASQLARVLVILEDAAKLIKNDDKILSKVDIFEALFYRYRALFHWVLQSSGKTCAPMTQIINKRHMTHAFKRYIYVPKFTIAENMKAKLLALANKKDVCPLYALFEYVVNDEDVAELMDASDMTEEEFIQNLSSHMETLEFIYVHDSSSPQKFKYIKSDLINIALRRKPKSLEKKRKTESSNLLVDILQMRQDDKCAVNPILSYSRKNINKMAIDAIHNILFSGRARELPHHLLVLGLRKCYSHKSTRRCKRSLSPLFGYIERYPDTIILIKDFNKMLKVYDIDRECVARQIRFEMEYGNLKCIGFTKSDEDKVESILKDQIKSDSYSLHYVE